MTCTPINITAVYSLCAQYINTYILNKTKRQPAFLCTFYVYVILMATIIRLNYCELPRVITLRWVMLASYSVATESIYYTCAHTSYK